MAIQRCANCDKRLPWRWGYAWCEECSKAGRDREPEEPDDSLVDEAYDRERERRRLADFF